MAKLQAMHAGLNASYQRLRFASVEPHRSRRIEHLVGVRPTTASNDGALGQFERMGRREGSRRPCRQTFL